MSRFASSIRPEDHAMNGHNKVDQPSAEKRTSNETAPGAKIEDIITIVSHLHSETQLHNPIAAYFLEMCRFSLLNPDLKLERYPLLLKS
jgi:hypothetical protein